MQMAYFKTGFELISSVARRNVVSSITPASASLRRFKSDVAKNHIRILAQASKLKESEMKIAAKAKKQKEKELEKAFKSYRRINCYSMFIKESRTGTIAENARIWKALSPDERLKFAKKANIFNESMLKMFPPKPRAPSSSYARYVASTYSLLDPNLSFEEKSAVLAKQWSGLSDPEKMLFKASLQEKNDFKSALDEWKKFRIASRNNLKVSS